MPDPKTNSTAPEGCAPLPGSEGLLRINYGINRRRPGSKSKTDIEHKCGKLTVSGTWNDDATHKAIRSKIYDLNPGWLISGYCPSDPQSAKDQAQPSNHDQPETH